MNSDVAVRQPTIATELGQRQPQFRAALPPNIRVENFVRVILTAVQMNPKLATADRQSLWTSCMKAAQDGLLPDGREGALVIYPSKTPDGWIDKVVWMPMIAGLRKKIRNSDTIATWDVHAVHARDHFGFELGDEPYIKHKPYMPKSLPRQEDEEDEDYVRRVAAHIDPGPLIAVYSVAVLKTGEKSREVMTRAEIDNVRDAYAKKDSKGNFSPAWIKSYDEMAKKTVARRHSKVLPMSTDLIDLLRRDDELYDLKGASNKVVTGPRPKSLSARLDALAGPEHTPHDPETGEVIDQVSGERPPETTADKSATGARDAGQDNRVSPPPALVADEARGPASASRTAARQRPPAPPPPDYTPPDDNTTLDHDALLQDLMATGERIAREQGARELDRWLDEDLTGDELAVLTARDTRRLKQIAAEASG